MITEDRLSVGEFFSGHSIRDYTFPTQEQITALSASIGEEDQEAFLTLAAQSWLQEPFDRERLFSDQGRVDLGEVLMEHSFLHHLLEVLKGNFSQSTQIIEELTAQHIQLIELGDPSIALDSFIALISHARTRDIKGKLRPFLHVQVQVWLRELRRLLAKVSPDNFLL